MLLGVITLEQVTQGTQLKCTNLAPNTAFERETRRPFFQVVVLQGRFSKFFAYKAIFYLEKGYLRKKMGENAPSEDMFRQILINQRAIMEQNQKNLQQQEQTRNEQRESAAIAQEKIPLILKVIS